MKNEHKQTPKTVPEIGIHIGYINEKLDGIVKKLEDSPSRSEFTNVETRVAKLEERDEKNGDKFVTRKEFAVLGVVAGFVVTLINLGLNFWSNFKG